MIRNACKWLMLLYFFYYAMIYDAQYIDLGWNVPTFLYLDAEPFIGKSILNVGTLIEGWGYIAPICIVLFANTRREIPILSDISKTRVLVLLATLGALSIAIIEKVTKRLFIWGVWGSWEAVAMLGMFTYLIAEALENKSISRNHKLVLLPSVFFSMILVFELPFQVLLVKHGYVPFSFLPYWLTITAPVWSSTLFILYLIVFSNRFGYVFNISKKFKVLISVFIVQFLLWELMGFPLHPSWGWFYKPLDNVFVGILEHIFGRASKIVLGFAHLALIEGFE